MTAATSYRQRATTPFGAIAAVARRAAAESEAIRWPSPRWQDDPVLFAREVLGIQLWSGQVEILKSIRDNTNTTCRSGHKCGKSTALAVAALWFYSTFDRARVFLTAVKATQIDDVIWKEIKRLYRQSRSPLGSFKGDPRSAVYPLDGEIFVNARTGLRADDERQVWGFTAQKGEGLAGISGPNILVLADEASGIADEFFIVLGSSLAGSGGTVRKCYISNPTKTTGEFYRSHTVNAALFHPIHLSSEDTPNARGTGEIPGLAGPAWIAEKKVEYGEDSAAYAVRVRGDFVSSRNGKIIAQAIIAEAQKAWPTAETTGDLQIGIDPAGDGVVGDETAVAVRIGSKIETVLTWRGQTEAAIVKHVLELLTTYRAHRGVEGVPRIAIDSEGGIGTRVLEKLRVALENIPHRTELISVRSGKKFYGSPEFDSIRDGLWGQTAEWLMAGGALFPDVKLAQELEAPSFEPDKFERYVATPKKLLRKMLGRSPDRADAVCLSIWGYASVETEELRADDVNLRRGHDVYEPPTDINAYEIDGLGGSDPVYG